MTDYEVEKQSNEELFLRLKETLDKDYLALIKQQLHEEQILMQDLLKTVAAFHAKNIKEDHTQQAKYQIQLHDLVGEVWGISKEKKFSDCYPELCEQIDVLISETDEAIEFPQERDRFYPVKDDSSYLKSRKLLKRSAFELTKLPFYAAQLFRKNKEPLIYWKHTVALRNLAFYHFKIGLIKDLKEVSALFFLKINAQYLSIKRWEEELAIIDFSETEKSFPEMEEHVNSFTEDSFAEISRRVNDILNQRIGLFQSEMKLAGTMEYANRRLTDDYIEKSEIRNDIRWAKYQRDWKNATYALFEEWRCDLDVHILRQQTLAELAEFKSGQIKKLIDYIDPEVEAIRVFIKHASASLLHIEESVSKDLKRIYYEASKELGKKLVPALCEKLASQDLVSLIYKLENSISQSVEELSDEHVVVKITDYDEPIATDELSRISPYELIAFETLVAFKSDLKLIKKDLFDTMERITLDSQDLDHIVTFSLSSAISALEEDAKTEEEVIAVAQEGLKRALNRLGDNRALLERRMVANSQRVEKAVLTFCERVLELTVNENVGQLRLRITKARAARHAEEMRVAFMQKLRTHRKQIAADLNKAYGQLSAQVRYVGDKFILTAGKPKLSKQVSDFLIESQEAIDQLPLIYRRLYKIEPLRDMELFEGRYREFEALQLAYDNWTKKRFAATAILGEKWGGLTTFINYCEHQQVFKSTTIRYTLKENCCTPQHFLILMRDVLKEDGLQSVEEVVNFLNLGTERIIILEDIQNLYLRKVHGFAAMQKLFEVIIHTSQKVFWVTSATVYTWDYLTKTIGINEYFSYIINLGALSNDQIINLILKRNRISGYNIVFELDEAQASDKKFVRMSPDQQQEKLKEIFFSELNGFARSNISLALIFWLLSTKKIEEDRITIGAFQKPNLNFLSVLSMNKIYVLHALIMHDGLSEFQLSEVLSMSGAATNLMLLSMIEDGIVLKRSNRFIINSMLYRDAIAVLKSKNLIQLS